MAWLHWTVMNSKLQEALKPLEKRNISIVYIFWCQQRNRWNWNSSFGVWEQERRLKRETAAAAAGLFTSSSSSSSLRHLLRRFFFARPAGFFCWPIAKEERCLSSFVASKVSWFIGTKKKPTIKGSISFFLSFSFSVSVWGLKVVTLYRIRLECACVRACYRPNLARGEGGGKKARMGE